MPHCAAVNLEELFGSSYAGINRIKFVGFGVRHLSTVCTPERCLYTPIPFGLSMFDTKFFKIRSGSQGASAHKNRPYASALALDGKDALPLLKCAKDAAVADADEAKRPRPRRPRGNP
jgi:hypothetical protein